MRIQFFLIALLLTPALPAQSDKAIPDTAEGIAIRDQDAERPLFLQPLDFSREDFGIAEKLERSKHARTSASGHFEKGMLYKQAANSLFNAGHLKRAHAFYQQAEAELLQAAEKRERAFRRNPELVEGQKGDRSTLQSSSFTLQRQQAAAAYYHLGLVCEKTRNDKSAAAECFAKARELDASSAHLARKLSRTREGRARLGVRSASDFRRLKEAEASPDRPEAGPRERNGK